MTSLPTLRRKIFRSFLIMILLYGVLGLVLVMSVLTQSRTTPTMLHVNYDSISAAIQMKQAWNALESPHTYSDHSPSFWKEQFEAALHFEEQNITEPGETEIATGIRSQWNQARPRVTPPETELFQKLDQLLSDLITVNERGMFKQAQQNTTSSRYILVGTLIYFLISLFLSFILAEGLAYRLSTPIKNIVEALHRRPEIGSRLRLITPNSLELYILTTELNHLWAKVTESEQMNVRKLIEQKSKLEIVLEAVEDALLVLDTQGKVTHSNKCMLDLINLPKDQVVGHSWYDLPTSHPNYLKLRSALQVQMDHSLQLELTLNRHLQQFSARHRKILGGGAHSIGILYLLHNITEKLQKQRFREEFIDLLSHEIKTPLQSLGTATELLSSQKSNFSELQADLIDTISEDVERIRAVANEFVQVTQSHSKVMKLRLETVELQQLLPEWIKPFKIVAKDRNITLNYCKEGSELISANLDRVKFPWVISNLLSNAIRFSPAQGVVTLLLTDRNGSVEVQVNDEGPGINAEDEKRIFEPFFQSPMATTSGKQGLFGIGLTIAKEVVEAHDGRIEYYRRQPQGSKFRIVLPYPPKDSNEDFTHR